MKIVEAFGSAASPHAFSLIAIAEQNLPIDFPEAALIQAKETKPDTIDKSARTDLRDIPFVTIDPADARDHDDAVYAEPDVDPDNQGGYVVWVAIADVAAYVTPDSAMDKEAESAAIRFTCPTGLCRCYQSVCPMICVRCASMKTARAWRFVCRLMQKAKSVGINLCAE